MINTQRLSLVPLTLTNLETALTSLNQLSDDLALPLVSDLMQGNTEAAVKRKLKKMRAVPGDLHPWYTYWLIVIIADNIGAGVVGFKGEPDAIGSVEIGYGLSTAYRGRGYMTEAVAALTDWGFSHRECLRVTATHVLIDNYPSQRVLTKAGFKRLMADNEGINYVKERD
jgi:RimJ/RimL family protein N-acetyltransferase